MLIVQNVSLYQGATALLKNVTFQVDKSDIVTIMGSSGSGKSSLFSWMVGALSPQLQASGELWLNERRVDALPTAQRQIGILFQDALLFDHFSVGQNLLLALPASLQGSASRPRTSDGKLGVNVAICCVNARFLLNRRHRMSSSFFQRRAIR